MPTTPRCTGLAIFNEHQIKFLSRLTIVVQMRIKAALELNGRSLSAIMLLPTTFATACVFI